MKNKYFILAGLLLVMMLLASAGPPDVPEVYQGYATIDGVLAPNGTFMEVKVNGTNESVGNTTINASDGSYMLFVYFDINETNDTDEGAEDGDLLVWYVNNSQADRPAAASDTASPGGVNNSFTVSIGETPVKIVDYSPSDLTPVVNENSNMTFTVTAIWPVYSNLTYNWSVDGTMQSGSSYFVYNSSAGENGTKDITIQVSNGSATDTESWTMTINRLPIITPNVPDLNLTMNTMLDFDLTPYETDYEDSGTNLIWSVSNVDSFYLTASVDSSTDILTLIPRLNRFGADNITLTLTDSDGGMDTQNIEINVQLPCIGINPPISGNWNITSNTSCSNANITLSGNSSVNVIGNVTLSFENVTLVLEDGELMAYDGGGSNGIIDSIVDTIIDWIT